MKYKNLTNLLNSVEKHKCQKVISVNFSSIVNENTFIYDYTWTCQHCFAKWTMSCIMYINELEKHSKDDYRIKILANYPLYKNNIHYVANYYNEPAMSLVKILKNITELKRYNN